MAFDKAAAISIFRDWESSFLTAHHHSSILLLSCDSLQANSRSCIIEVMWTKARTVNGVYSRVQKVWSTPKPPTIKCKELEGAKLKAYVRSGFYFYFYTVQ